MAINTTAADWIWVLLIVLSFILILAGISTCMRPIHKDKDGQEQETYKQKNNVSVGLLASGFAFLIGLGILTGIRMTYNKKPGYKFGKQLFPQAKAAAPEAAPPSPRSVTAAL